jgi:hypothetical protein
MNRAFLLFLVPLAALALLAAGCGSSTSSASVSPGAANRESTAFAPTFDPADFTGAAIDNPYFPLEPGTTFVYGGTEEKQPSRDVVTVTHRMKTVLGVACTVVRDRLFLSGKLAETTADWYAQDKDGNVWYLGEDTKELKDGKVVSREGSWQAGVKGAIAGIIMQADPHVGDTYRQEFLKGKAEDRAQVLSLDTSASVPYGSFETAQLVKEWSPLEPNVIDHKYYARGVGLVREVTVEGPRETGELVQVTASG